MGVPLQVLLVEDSAQDAVLLLEELHRGDYAPVHMRVDTAEAMAAALEEQTWDVILSDHAMPRFSAMEALALVKRKGLDLPFIIVSGAIDEEAAVEAMRAGAHDYLRKDNLARLNPAVARELQDAVERRERRRAEEELRRYREHLEQLVEERTAELESKNAQLAAEIGERERVEQALRERENELRLIMDAAPAAISYIDAEGLYRRVNRTYEQWFDRSAEDIEGRHVREVLGEPTYQIVRPYLERVLAGEQIRYQWELPFPGGDKRWLDATYVPDRDDSGRIRGFVVLGVDIGKLREAEEQVKVSLMDKEAAERARAELAEVLNREINHRVKNNLSMVAGMLQMQIASDQDPRLVEMLQDAIARLYAFASVHDQLTVTGSGEVDVTAAIRRCAEAARQVFLQGAVAVSVEGDALQYPGSTAASLSMVANELITNGLKHGGPDGDGQIHVDVHLSRDNGAFRLSVWNSGNPVPADMDRSQQTGMGLSLVQGLVVGQYGGSFTLGPERGGTLAQVVLDDERLREG